jgi:hypothetical protein
MTDDMAEKYRRERDRIADLGYEVEVLAKRTGIPRLEIFKLIEKHGRDRETLLREAELSRDHQRQPVGDAHLSGRRDAHHSLLA